MNMESHQENDKMLVGISAVRTLNDFFKIIQDNDILNVLDSVTFDVKSQKIIFEMQKLLKKESDSVESKMAVKDTADARIAKLSEEYKNKYPELLDFFKSWKPCREKLIKTLRSSSKSLENSSTFVSAFRILTSAADIFGTFARVGGKPEFSLADFGMKYASTCGVLALVLKLAYFKKKHSEVKKAAKTDQEILEKIVEWFKQTEELDAAIKSFFPYGIDTDIVNKINNCSSKFDDEDKIFMSIFASNVKKNVKLFKNKEFLDKAERIATSEAGKQWFNKIILEKDPYFQHILNTDLGNEIQDILKTFPIDNRDVGVEVCRELSSKVHMKITLNMVTMISSASSILYEEKPEICENFDHLAESTQKDLEEIQKIVRLMKPSNFELDPSLQ